MAQQLPLGASSLPVRRVIDDYGAVGKGASLAHYVCAENGTEYIMKGPSFTPNHRYVGANETIAATIAGSIGLPILDACILEMKGRCFFGSSWMEKPSFYPRTDAATFHLCENKERVYGVLAFDIFLCNSDRHEENLVVRKIARPSGGSPRHLLLLNDHSHCMVLPNESVAALTTRIKAAPSGYVRLDFAREAVVDPAKLSQAVATIESLSDGVLIAVVQSMPGEFLPDHEKGIYMSFLRERRSHLRELINSDATLFPKLNGGKI
jgi:hypothetical protein